MNTEIKFLRQNAVQDIFSFVNQDGEIDYIYFPRSMEMSVEDVTNYN